jgi:hypothetical protein
MHQCLIQWDGDEVEVVHADDSIEISLAAMSVWDAEDQEPISGMSLKGCDHVEATKNEVRILMTNVSHSGNNHKGARSNSRPYNSCNISSVNEYDKAADLNDRPKLFLSRSSSICSDLADDGKLGYGFTSADELEEVDIGPGDKSRPTFVSKKLDPSLRELMIALLKEYSDCFAWDYTEMPGLERSIVEHRLPLKKGFRPFQQRARQMRTEVLEEVKKEIEKMLEAGFIRPCRYAE